ncbi:MAG: 4-hydroxythreonine-4-phosphate dehydrogenase PdxA [Deltaproteobacteria bacterium]|nr:MAG: 4-hydroxythreonine-4-phosphate dehydrogenase PdxA [Deltaproteobacteria bacterium]
MAELPRIAVTIGDPAGIGPEIISEAFLREDIYRVCRPLVLGDVCLLRIVSKRIGPLPFREIQSPMDAVGRPGTIDVIPVSRLKKGSVTPGRPTAEGGTAMVTYILKAVELATSGEVAAMVTCPINKELMNQVGYGFEGHTQLIAHLTQTKDYTMMLAGEKLRVALATIHCPLRDVAAKISKELIMKTITITCHAMERDFGIENPRVAVAALNPHAGEAGLFGREDMEIIKPAVEEVRDSGLSVEGPFPADTVFYHAVNGRFDAVVAMYHDQGLIPLKLLHFSNAVNITLGLPIVRTSVDHGTAYDIAGRGMADPSSLIAAVKMAAKIAGTRQKTED